MDPGAVLGVGRRSRRPPRIRGALPPDWPRRQRGGSADADGGVQQVRIQLPDPSLVVMVGASGSGKSTFAREHFMSTEVISSDFCRGLVSDDENNQAAT